MLNYRIRTVSKNNSRLYYFIGAGRLIIAASRRSEGHLEIGGKKSTSKVVTVGCGWYSVYLLVNKEKKCRRL